MRWTDRRWTDGILRKRAISCCLRATYVWILITSASVFSAGAQQPALPPRSSTTAAPQFLVVLDAAHGGTDTGAHLAAHLEEKDLVLGLSILLRSMLAARGIRVITTRESDETMPPGKRAALANAQKAAACLILHASESGSGIHLFTSSLPPARPRTFLPWDQAQAAFLDQSQRWAAEIDSAMTHAGVPVTLGRTAMQPLDNMTCPTAAIEIAPLSKANTITATLTDADYQSRVLAALAAAVEGWRRDWTLQP